MKVWHKILVAPAAAILCLLALGTMAYIVLHRQHAALDDLFNTRFAGYRVAAPDMRHLMCDSKPQFVAGEIAKRDG